MQDPTSPHQKLIDIALSKNANSTMITNARDHLIAQGRIDPWSLFLTGSAGAGKTTHPESSRQICYEFSTSCGIIWSDT